MHHKGLLFTTPKNSATEALEFSIFLILRLKIGVAVCALAPYSLSPPAPSGQMG